MGKNYFDWETMQWYDSYEEARPAKQRYKQQKLLEEEKKLLDEQNDILIEKSQKEEEDRKKERELTKQLIEEQRYSRQHENMLEEERKNHNEEMRLKKICDNIGISKTLIDGFEETLSFSLKHSNLFLKRKKIQEKIDSLYNKMDELHDYVWTGHHDECVNDISPEYSLEGYKIFRKARRFTSTFYDKDLASMLDEKARHSLLMGLNIFVIIVSIICLPQAYDISFIFWILIVYNYIRFFIRIFNIAAIDKQMNSICDEKIKENQKLLKEYQKRNGERQKKYEKESDEYHKASSEFNELCSKRLDLDIHINEISHENIKNNLDDFYEFRINHYNPEIEKLLLDFEFDKKYEDAFEMISKKESHKNGTIDDYIDYFLSKIKEYKKYKSE